MEGESGEQHSEGERQQSAEQALPQGALIQPPEPPQRENATQPPGNEPKKRCWRDKRWRHPQVIVNGALAFVAVIAAIIYYCQLKQMGKNARLDQRAWLAVTQINAAEPKAGELYRPAVVIKNTGKTFAKHAHAFVYWEEVLDGAKPDFDKEEREIQKSMREGSGVIVAPNADYTLTLNTNDGKPLSEPQANDMKSGRAPAFIHGKIVYRDIFNCEHWTIFCGMLRPDQLGYSAEGDHNNADDNRCP